VAITALRVARDGPACSARSGSNSSTGPATCTDGSSRPAPRNGSECTATRTAQATVTDQLGPVAADGRGERQAHVHAAKLSDMVNRLIGLALLLNRVPDHIFDYLFGVSTWGCIFRGASVFAGRDNCAYEGSQWLPTRSALKELAPGPSDVFVDLGSGKGKVLLIAGRLPLQRVVGVEIDEELSECANRNIRQAKPRLRAQSVESVAASVLDWPIPDETSIIYLSNPFIGQTFRSTVNRIIESYDRLPRTLHIVYYYPWEHDWLMSTGRVIVEGVRSGNWLVRPRWWQGGHVIITYRVAEVSEVSQSRRSSNRARSRAIRRWSGPNGHCFTMSAPGEGIIYSRS
jgi:hypothetical protein